MFISAGNSGPGLNTIGDPCGGDEGHERRRLHHRRHLAGQLRLRLGVRRQPAPLLLARPARGRRLQAQLVAPGAADLHHPDCGRPGGPVGGTYALPPGYAMLNGTSMASPQAAGAARAAGQRREAGRRAEPAGPAAPGADVVGPLPRPALPAPTSRATACINVGAAWDLLKTNIKTGAITSSVPVNTVLTRLPGDAGRRRGHLRPRGRGRGRRLHPHLHLRPHHGRRQGRSPTT